MSSLFAADVNVAQNVGFYIIAAIMVFGALRVVSGRNVVHAALWLVVVLGGVAAQYLLAAAEFVAISQVMVYIGAVMVLFLFGIMLTRATIGEESDLNNKNWAIGIPVALLLAGTLVWVIVDEYGGEEWIARSRGGDDQTVAAAWSHLEARGLAVDGRLSDAGRSLRLDLEQRTDELTAPVWQAIGETATLKLLDLVEPHQDAFVQRIDETAGPRWMPAVRPGGSASV